MTNLEQMNNSVVEGLSKLMDEAKKLGLEIILTASILDEKEKGDEQNASFTCKMSASGHLIIDHGKTFLNQIPEHLKMQVLSGIVETL